MPWEKSRWLRRLMVAQAMGEREMVQPNRQVEGETAFKSHSLKQLKCLPNGTEFLVLVGEVRSRSEAGAFSPRGRFRFSSRDLVTGIMILQSAAH